MKFTHFKHILALPTYGLTCPGFEWWALKKWKMEPGHPVWKISKLAFSVKSWNNAHLDESTSIPSLDQGPSIGICPVEVTL